MKKETKSEDSQPGRANGKTFQQAEPIELQETDLIEVVGGKSNHAFLLPSV